MTAYYNEIDAYAAQWLRNLIAAGHIAPGDVDERDIRDVRPDDLKGYTQCHFFAGIGVWSHALRLAGWPDDRPVWTGSCPCQPFSAAGRRGGTSDERHLWPAFFHLVDECRPASLFGEQVASKDGLGWLDLVQADMEGAGYAFGASDLCVAGFGGPHIRQRLFFGAQRVEYPGDDRPQGRIPGRPGTQRETVDGSAGCHGAIERLADPECKQRRKRRFAEASHAGRSPERAPPRETFGAHVATGGLADDNHNRCDTAAGAGFQDEEHNAEPCDDHGGLADAANSTEQREIARPAIRQFSQGVGAVQTRPEQPRPTDGFWRAADWLFCRDGKWRPVRPGSFPLVNGAPSRVGRLRAYGNAISPYPAKAFIESFDEACRDARRVQLEEMDVFS